MKLKICLLALLMLCSNWSFGAPVNFALGVTPPTAREDGTPLAASEIAEYRIYGVVDGAAGAALPQIIVIESGTQTNYSINLPPRAEPYTAHFAATAVDTGGRESAMSDIVSLQFDVISTAAPGKPTVVIMQVDCTGGACQVRVAE